MPGDALQDWLDAVSALDVLAGLAWIGGILVALRWLRPIAERIRSIAEDWTGTPARPGVPATPGVMERLGEVKATVDAHTVSIEEIRHQVTPNTGSSAHDALMRNVDELRELVVGLIGELGEFRGEYARDLRANHPTYRPHRDYTD